MKQNDMEASDPKNDNIDFGNILKNYMRHWWWFAISIILCVGLAFIYIKKKSPVYSIKSMIMVNQDEDDGGSSMNALNSLLGSFGGSASGVNVDDEILKIASHSSLVDLTHNHELNFCYWSTSGILAKKHWLYNESPVKIHMPQAILDTLSATTRFDIDISKKGTCKLNVKQNGNEVLETTISSWPYRARTPYGTFTLDTTRFFIPGMEMDLHASAAGTEEIVAGLSDIVGVMTPSKKTNAIEIYIEDVCVPRGIDLVNSLVNNYNDMRLNERIKSSETTLKFVEDRLLKFYNELESSETEIEAYKKANNIVNAEAEAQYIFTRKGSIETSYAAAKTRLEIFKMVRDMLAQPENKYSLLPFAGSQTELGDAFNQMLTAYNDLILKRMELESTAKGQNAQLVKLTSQIDAMRKNILSSVNREIESTKITLANISSEEKESSSRIKDIPSMEHRLTMLYRDREIKNQLYGYLLQKREEAEIAVAQQKPVAKVIDSAYALPKPISPKKMVILAAAFVFGLLIPVILLNIQSARRRKSQKEKTHD